MSAGRKIPFEQAYEIAQRASIDLRDSVQRIKVVGSIRRRSSYCGDVEFVAEPYFDDDFFGVSTPSIEPIRRVLEGMGSKVGGKDRQLVVHDLYGQQGLRLELYLVHPPATWGVQLGIRTGPWEMSKYLVTACSRRGYPIKDVRAVSRETGKQVPTDTEEEFFALAGIEWVKPQDRKARAIELINDMDRYGQGVGRG